VSKEKVERLTYSTVQVRTITPSGRDKRGHAIDFLDQQSAREFAETVRGGKLCRIVRVETAQTVIEVARYETP
jgi:DNA topoisomerase IA